MPGTLCPFKGYIRRHDLIVIGGYTWKLTWDQEELKYQWMSWNGSEWVDSSAPPSDHTGYTIADPAEPDVFYTKGEGYSGIDEPDWTDIPGDTFEDNELVWTIIGADIPGDPTWESGTLYEIDDNITVDPTIGGPRQARVTALLVGKGVECVKELCRFWDANAGEEGECGGAPNLGGGASSPPPAYAKLIGEYQGNEDLDGNGKVYGKDFKITDDDTKPPALTSIEQDPDWVDPPEAGNMTWQEYLDSLGA
jgi:hypothetical protein